MQRTVYILLFFVVLLTPIVLRWSLGRKTESLTRDALPLIIITPHGEPIRREFETAFSRWHEKKYGKPVDINYLTFGGGADIRRTLDGRRDTMFRSRQTYEIDLAWGGGDDLFNRQLYQHLDELDLDPGLMRAVFPSPTLGGLPLYDQGAWVDRENRPVSQRDVPDARRSKPRWWGTALSSFGISYNRDVVKKLGLPEPRTWRDLADPRYEGWIILADPTKSSSAKAAFMVIVERAMADAVQRLPEADRSDPAKRRAAEDIGWAEGMGIVRQIASNARNFNDASQSIPSVISSGDVAAGMTIDFFARSQIQFVGDDRMGYVEPANATIINPDPIALIRGAPNRETAIRFIEFILSEEGQLLWNIPAGNPDGPALSSLRRLAIRPDVYSQIDRFADRVNPFESASDFNTSRDRTATFVIIGELIQASSMDLLRELRATRQAILASPRRSELEARFNVFPFTQEEALARSREFNDRRTPTVRRLELMRQWTNEFREEYRKLQLEAGASTAGGR